MSKIANEIDINMEFINIIGIKANKNRKESLLMRIARSDKNVLILGETGTGKDVLARKIHEWSERKNEPFIAINCANIPQELFEAELFGFEKGSFTGAWKEKMGLLEAAQKGTAFLDEIGELSLMMQAKLLRVIENRIFRRVGETKDRICEARFIFATNKDLSNAVKKGNFREDLYYRISIIQIYLSPLRDHPRLLPKIIKSILNRENNIYGQNKKITKKAIRKLMSYHYPGNMRELINIIERAFLLADGDLISAENIQFNNFNFEAKNNKVGKWLNVVQLREILEACHWNKSEAARRIGTSRRHLYRLMQKYRIDYS